MGKGLPAGLLMSNLQGALRILSSDIASIKLLVEKLNSWLCRNVPVTKFVSLVCLELDRVDAVETRVTYSNAGHCPPILIRKNGDVERLGVTGGVLGVHEKFAYEEHNQILNSGDLVMLYTDGIVEAEDCDGQLFDESRLIEFIRANRAAPAANILDNLILQICEFSGRKQADDDLTAILLRKK